MAIKNLVTISLTIFIILIVVVLGSGLLFNQNKASITQTTQQKIISITKAEVAKHNSANDCWTIVSNKVYDVTSLIPIHSGGPDKIIAYCGKDATTAFNTRNGKGPHSQKAQDALNNYYVGNLN
ncbi:MAG: cytochrome b5-like heme/steroid binding domain-containing protein [Candidatus Staskawiczbacteria bacterium]|nr:cytochrome b5-like heme/steroid binding domain-containing protein [Candidatus Staskawiczbacteria bacterium]